MLEFGACPQCKMEVAKQRLRQFPVICNHCGYSVNQNKVTEIETSVRFTFTIIATVIMLGFMQLITWDKFAIEVIPLKVKDTIGIMSLSDFEQLNQICAELKKWQCVESTLTHFQAALAARPDMLQIQVVQNYVRILMTHQRYNEARKLINNIRGKGPEAASFMESEFQQIKEFTTALR